MGFPRSGTTLLEVILDGHPDVVSLEEHDLFTEGVLRYLHDPRTLEPLMRRERGGAGEPARGATGSGCAPAAHESAGKVFVDKHPLNTLKLPADRAVVPERQDPVRASRPAGRRAQLLPAPLQDEPGHVPDAHPGERRAVLRRGDATWPRGRSRYSGLPGTRCATRLWWRTSPGRRARICEFLGIEWTAGLGEFASRVQLRASAHPQHRAAGARPGAVRGGPLAVTTVQHIAPVEAVAVTLDRALRDASANARPGGYCERCARKVWCEGVVSR